MLKNQCSIYVDNLHGIDAELREKDNKREQITSIRTCFCHLDADGKTFFLNLGQYNFSPVNLLIKPEDETQCVNTITNFISKYRESQPIAEPRKLIKSPNKHACIFESR